MAEGGDVGAVLHAGEIYVRSRGVCGITRRGDGIALLSASIAGLGLALIGATMFEFAKQACYARHDVIAPLVGCAVMVSLLLVGAPIAVHAFDGPRVLLSLGLFVTGAL